MGSPENGTPAEQPEETDPGIEMPTDAQADDALSGEAEAEAQVEADAQDEYDDEDDVAEAQEADDYYSRPENQPEPLTVESDDAVEDLIGQAVGMSYANFRQRHFMTAKVLTARMGEPVEFLTETLSRDEDYRALLASTESDIDASRIAKVVVTVALKLAEKILITL